MNDALDLDAYFARIGYTYAVADFLPEKGLPYLEQATQLATRIPTKDLRTAEPLNAFFFAPAMGLSAGPSLSKIFSTHPSLERRLAELDKVQRQLSGQGK